MFNLVDDPEELVDLAADPAHAATLDDLTAELAAICDAAAVDKAARARQAEMVEENGGREAIIERGDLGFSVPPGVQPMFD